MSWDLFVQIVLLMTWAAILVQILISSREKK
jgi:hypothetical protein